MRSVEREKNRSEELQGALMNLKLSYKAPESKFDT